MGKIVLKPIFHSISSLEEGGKEERKTKSEKAGF